MLAYDSMTVIAACIIQIIGINFKKKTQTLSKGINFNLIIIRVRQQDAE